MLVYLLLVVGGMPVATMGPRGTALYLVGMLALSALLILICWKKGEPPKWRG